MAITKKSLFIAPQREIANVAKALAHPARVAIIELLAKKGSCICNSIVNELPLAQSTISQHLKALKDAGLIKGAIDGPSVCYCINKEAWISFKENFNNLFQMIDDYQNNPNC